MRIVRACDVDNIDIVVVEHLIDRSVDLRDAVLLRECNRFRMRAVADSIKRLTHFLQSRCHLIRDHTGSEHRPI